MPARFVRLGTFSRAVCLMAPLLVASRVAAAPPEASTFERLHSALRAVPAIDTHDHLYAFERLPARVPTPQGDRVNLAGLWHNSYFRHLHALEPWRADQPFDAWWAKARDDFDDARATSVYRYLLPAFRDLYGVDFDRLTDAEAAKVNEQVLANYRDERWIYEVVRRANIELMFIDPHWGPFDFPRDYDFAVPVFRVDPFIRGVHPGELRYEAEDPYKWAAKRGMKCETFDDYLAVVDALFEEAARHGVVGMKSGQAYLRSLQFEPTTKEAAAAAFGKSRTHDGPEAVAPFENFMFWRLAELAVKHDLPFQIHTGIARVQGSNPLLLADLIQANPKTKFVLFHGGYPWIGETGVLALRFKNVWIDSNWLPTLSQAAAKRAYHEWLDVVPSNRILWGGDCNHIEGTYGAAAVTRRILAEVLAERVAAGGLTYEHAERIGRQILRENAVELYPRIRARLNHP